jgi:PAS domain S-box-containing protein
MTTVLVVDDSGANREVTHSLLDGQGYEVVEAGDGTQALALAQHHRPELVITDVLMPGMDGYELARLLRGDPDTADTAIIFYSGNYDERELRPIADAYHVNSIVTKSSDPQPLLDAVDDVLARAGQSESTLEPPIHGDRQHLQLVNDKLVDTVQRLRGTEQRLRTMVDGAPVGIVVGTDSGEATYANPALATILGVDPDGLLGLGWLACLDPGRREDALAATRRPDAGAVLRLRDDVETPAHGARWLEVQLRCPDDGEGNPAGFVAIVEDVTDSVTAEQQREAEHRRRSQEADWRTDQRMESLRRLAGGAAHDYNNILASVLAHAEFLQEAIADAATVGALDTGRAAAMTADLDSILVGSNRAARLTRQLLLFGHRGPARTASTDLNASLAPEIDILRATLNRSIAVVERLEPGLPPVVADEAHVAEVLRHLASNASDAMPDGGALTIETALIGPDDPVLTVPPRVRDCRHVRLTVRDDGIGMPTDTAEHAVEPFYTNKTRAQASGLGLTTVQGIVNQSGGDLIIDSKPGIGTSVHVILPASGPPAPPPAAAPLVDDHSDETILVVDDEEPIRDLVARILSRAGYRVLCAADAGEAMAVVRAYSEPIHCLLTDLIMPGVPGTELARRLRAERPDLRVVFMSGYAEPLREGTDAGIPLLFKPFTKAALLATVLETAGRR